MPNHQDAERTGAERPLALVADDEPEMRQLLAEVLDGIGFRTVTAGDGAAMLELADRHRPALVVVDIMMPLMDGYSAIARLRGQRATADVPVVVITGRSEPVYRALSEGVGVSAHLTKPFSPTEFAAVVRRLVPRGRA